MQYVKSVSGTWHRFRRYGDGKPAYATAQDGGLLAQTDCDRLVKVARLTNTKPSGKRLNPMSWCCECRWTE